MTSTDSVTEIATKIDSDIALLDRCTTQHLRYQREGKAWTLSALLLHLHEQGHDIDKVQFCGAEENFSPDGFSLRVFLYLCVEDLGFDGVRNGVCSTNELTPYDTCESHF